MVRATFIVDSGPSVGLGHLSRSLVLLEALERKGVACTLHCVDTASALALGQRAEALPTSLSDLGAADLIHCDSYRLSLSDLQILRERCRLLSIQDDTADRPLPVDVVINHNLAAPRFDYGKVTSARVLAGADYALVGERIMAASRRRTEQAPDEAVVISFGGTDDGTISAKAAEALIPRTQARLDVIVSAGREPAAALLRTAGTQPGRINVHHGPDVPRMLARCRMYLGSAGMMSFEALAVGLELVVVPIADNQRSGAEALVAFGHDMVPDLDIDLLAKTAADRLKLPRPLKRAPIDGKGGERAAAVLLQELEKKPALG
jgi:spore coat polysaccharide biosynthesis predicted glycosyltransferase SpsG